ncbi:MAG: hypothetical protein Q8M03_14600 [Legionella sp.]|nr:hypothetical protein [Legionella sp.]
MKNITIYVQYLGKTKQNEPSMDAILAVIQSPTYQPGDVREWLDIEESNPIIAAIKAATSSPAYQLNYDLTIEETNKKPDLYNEWVSCSHIVGKSLIFYYISDRKIEELAPDEAKEVHDQLQAFSNEYRDFICQEMNHNNKFQDEFDVIFLQDTLKIIDKEREEAIEKSERVTHHALEEMKQSSETRMRRLNASFSDSSLLENYSRQPGQNQNILFAAPKNHYFKKAAAEFCIGTVLGGAGALLFAIEPISASILLLLALLLYLATIYHVSKGFSEQENPKPVEFAV